MTVRLSFGMGKFNIFQFLLRFFVVSVVLFSGPGYAANTIQSATVNGATSATVTLGATVTVAVTNTTSGGTDWGSTQWFIGTTAPGTWASCDAAPTPTTAADGTYTYTLNGPVTVPTTLGSYNLYLRTSSSGSNCANNLSSVFTLPNAIAVIAAAPSVTTSAATGLAATGATLNGVVSSNGASTAVTFDYGLTTAYGSSATATSSPLAASAVNSAVSAALSGLTCNTTYHFRAKGFNGAGTTNGGDLTFTTTACPPTVATNAASGVASPGVATLNGTVSSNGASTTVTFDYGLTTAYGYSVTAAQSPLSSSAAGAAVSAALSGLVCNATYHYRVNGSNSAGAASGGDQTFTTPVCPVVLGKAAGSAAATVDSYVTFSLTAMNPNSTDLSNVVLADVIPTEMTYNTYAATMGSAAVAGQTMTWTIPTLPAGATAQLTLVVKLNQRGTFVNTVTSTGAVSASAGILVLASSYVQYRMDEKAGSWNGTSGEVVDSGVNSLHGQRRTTSTPTTTNAVVPVPTIVSQQPSVVGSFCNAGQFDGNAVVESASSSFFQFTNQLSASAWIYPTAYPSSDLSSILSNDTNYEFHLNTSGKLYWWWQASTLTSNTTIPLNQWTHIAITLDSTAANRRQRIYVNGVQDSATNNWTGTLTANACPFYIGGDISTGSGCSLIPGRNFHGMVDEVKIYNYELNSAEVQADMTLGRLCSGIFDHIRIEHDGTASTCNPKTVTLKACLNSSCTSLYPGTVTVRLSPTGWVGGDTITINGGVATATLANSSISAPSVTLGTVSVTPTPSSTPGTRCFNGATETCTLSVASTSCAFDAVEPGASPQTHLFTKLAGAQFNVDVLALSNPTTVNTAYTGTVVVDLVDTSTVACPNGAVLSTAQPSVTFAAADKGRKTVALTSNGVAKSTQVRIKSGTSYACSYDKLAVRPSAATLTSSTTFATAPSAGATPTIKAGANFSLGAVVSPAGYSELMAQDASKLSAQLPSNDSTQQSGGIVGALTPTSLIANASQVSAAYGEVGYLYINPGAFSDKTFTNVDQISQVAGCAATDTCDCLLSTSQTNAGVPDNVSDVLINGRYGCYVGNKVTMALGRFVPDHFAATPGAVTPACSTFTYFSQDGISTAFTLTAQNASNGTTQNYTALFGRLGLTTWGAAPASSTSSGFGFSTSVALPTGASLAAGVPAPTGAWNNGVATVSAKHQVTRPSSLTGLASDTQVSVTTLPVDADGVTMPVAAVVQTASTPFRYGRLWLGNAYGSDRSSLSLPYETQYWNGFAFVKNTLDNCTALTLANVGLGNYQNSVTSTNLPASSVGLGAFASGSGSVTLPAPNAAGSVDVVLRLDSALAMCATGWVPNYPAGTATSATYLRGNWCGTGFNRDPVVRATFGISRTGRQIYLREGF